MRGYALGKENISSIVNQRSSLLRTNHNHNPSHETMLRGNKKHNNPIVHSKVMARPLRICGLGDSIDSQQQYNDRESIQSKISRILKKQLFDQSPTYRDQLTMIRRRNRELLEENQQLKKQVDYIGRQGERSQQISLDSLREMDLHGSSDIMAKRRLEESRSIKKLFPTEPVEYKNVSEQSVVFSQQVERMYQNALKENKVPNVESLTVALKQYIKQHESFCVKISFLLSMVSSPNPIMYDLQQLVSAIKLPLLYNNNPPKLERLVEKRFTSEKRLNSKRKSSRKEGSILESFAPELLSPDDILVMLEQLLQKIVKSPRMMETMSYKNGVTRLLRKIAHGI